MASEWGFAVISTIRWAVFLRGDRQDQQKKLSDEQLVLNAQSDKTAIGELIARYICTVEFLAKNMAPRFTRILSKRGLWGFWVRLGPIVKTKMRSFQLTLQNV